ncbi:HAD-like domain-containing protein [Usnea florida]
MKPPKVVLFDIGGVCVLSPFQGIIDYERKHGIPTDWVNYAISFSSPNGHWQRLERGEIKMDANFFKGFTADLQSESAWKGFHGSFRNEKKNTGSSLPPIPSIDGESLFWSMMNASRHLDPYVFPALERLSSRSSRPILGALSNTVIYPPEHPWSRKELPSPPSNPTVADAFFLDPKKYFDVYIASAEVGMRKPSRDIYDLAIQRLDEFDKQKGGQGITPEDVVFLDDIGENLKMGREVGMKTIRVQLGKTWRAVKELESILGDDIDLMDEKTRRSKL